MISTKTITFHSAHNYGAVLQAYALQQTFLKLGFSNQIINSSKDKNSIFKQVRLASAKAFVAGIIENALRASQYAKMRNSYLRFESFINDELSLTKKYQTIEELRSEPPSADCYIAGSDQVWNAVNGCFPAFFLDFGTAKTRRVSYAASMGTYNLSTENEKELVGYLRTFSKISVRESEAGKYIEERTACKCLVNVDPVFLLNENEWGKVCAEPQFKDKYILCYPLMQDRALNPILQKLKKLTGLPVVLLSQNARNVVKGDRYVRDAGPKEFLSLIKNAEYVVTTSFHGTAFSVIFQRKFFSMPAKHSPTRVYNILEKLKLQERIVNSADDVKQLDIDFSMSNIILKAEREKSFGYLRNIMVDEYE